MKKTNYWQVLIYIVYAIVIIFAFLAISSKLSVGGFKLLVVKSGSMEPTIKTGSMVIDKTVGEYQIGDIITFKNSESPSETMTHRLVDIEYQGSTKFFQTKGDANDSPDSAKITADQIVGKVIFKVPYFGYIVSFTRTLPGLIIFIVMPALIIIYEEIKNIKKEIILRKNKKSS